jgi:hypothetical protein
VLRMRALRRIAMGKSDAGEAESECQSGCDGGNVPLQKHLPTGLAG